MMHPPDPRASDYDEARRNVHVSMNISIMTDGPGGMTFNTMVNAPGYGADQMEQTYGYPYNALGYEGFDPGQNNMITWPVGASSETQTEEPIVQLPGDTTKDSEQEAIVEAQQPKPESSDDKERRKHRSRHKHHKRSKSGGADSRSQSSMSYSKSDLDQSVDQQSGRRSGRSRHKSGDNSSRKSRSRPDSEQNYGADDTNGINITTPFIVPLENDDIGPNAFQQTLEDFIARTTSLFPDLAANFADDKKNAPFSSGRNASTGSFFINTFADEIQNETTFPVYESFQEVQSNMRGTDSLNLLPSQSSITENVSKEIAKQEKAVERDIKHMAIQCYGPPRARHTQTDHVEDQVVQVVQPISTPDLTAVLEPLVKLTEQLAVANLQKTVITEETKTEVTTYTETLNTENGPKLIRYQQTASGYPINKFAPLETLINDVGVESKEIQTLPEKNTIGTSTDVLSVAGRSVSGRSKQSSLQLSFDDSLASTPEPYPKRKSKSKQRIYPLPGFETVLNDVAVESKEVQTLPEKTSISTNTENLSPPIQPRDRWFDPLENTVSDFSIQAGSSVSDHIIPKRSTKKPAEQAVIATEHNKYESLYRGSAASSDLSVQVGSTMTPIKRPQSQKPQERSPENQKPLFNIKYDVPTGYGVRRSSDMSVQAGSIITNVSTINDRDLYAVPENEMKNQSLSAREQAVVGIHYLGDETNVDDIIDDLPSETHSAVELRSKSAENFAYESASATPLVPESLNDQESDTSSTVKSHSSKGTGISKSASQYARGSTLSQAKKSSGSENGNRTPTFQYGIPAEQLLIKQPSSGRQSSAENRSARHTPIADLLHTDGRPSPVGNKSSSQSKNAEIATRTESRSSPAGSRSSHQSKNADLPRTESPGENFYMNAFQHIPSFERLSSVESGSGRDTPVNERVAKNSANMKRLREDFFNPFYPEAEQMPSGSLSTAFAEKFAEPINTLENLLQNRLKQQQTQVETPKSSKYKEPSYSSKPAAPPPAPPKVVPTISTSVPVSVPPPPPPPPPSVVSKLPSPEIRLSTESKRSPISPTSRRSPISPREVVSPKPPESPKRQQVESKKSPVQLAQSTQSPQPKEIKYKDFVMQQRLMPSARIFEMHTRGPAILNYTRSPRSSIANPNESPGLMSEIDEHSVEYETSSISGFVRRDGLYTVLEVNETINLERMSDFGDERLASENTPMGTWDSRYDSTMSKEDSVVKMTSNTADRCNSFFETGDEGYNKQIDEDPNFSAGTIDSERSSLSGVGHQGAYNVRDLEMADENVSDYAQDQLSPIGRVGQDNSSYGAETPTHNSIASETSMKADRSHEMYSKVPKETSPTPLKGARSFAEIMRTTSTYVSERLSFKLDPVAESVDEHNRSRSSTKTSTIGGSSIDNEGSGVYVVRPNRRSRDTLNETDSTISEENVREYSQGRISPMLDTNYNSQTSTLTSFGDYERESTRVAKLVNRPSLHLSREGIYQGKGVETRLDATTPTPIDRPIPSVRVSEARSASSSSIRKPFVQTEL